MNIVTRTLSKVSRKASTASIESIVSKVSVGSKTDWTSIYLASFLSFIGSVQYGLYLSSLFPYLEQSDPNASIKFFGFIVSSYSVTQLITSPIIGIWSDKIKQIKLPIQVGLLFMLVGNLCHIFMLFFPPTTRRFIMLAGRMITGVGSANTLLLKAYATSASSSKDRSHAIAWITGAQAIGTTIAPAFQAIFSGISAPGFHLFGPVYFNLFTAGAYVAVAMNIAGMVILQFFFHESYAGVVEKDDSSSSSTPIKLPNFDILAMVIMNITRFTQMFVQSNLETIATSFSMIMFSWTSQEAIMYGSIAQGALGLLSFIVYFVYIFFKLNRFMKFRIALFWAMVGLFTFHLLTFSYPFYSGSIDLYTTADENNVPDSKVGCNTDKFKFCDTTKPINVWIWLISYPVIIGIGFSIINIAMNTLYSKIIGPRRMATWQSIMQMSGGAARIIGPLSIGGLYEHFGPRPVWGIEFAVIGANIGLLGIFHKRLVALRIPAANVEENYSAIVNEGYESSDENEIEQEIVINKDSSVLPRY
uniref:MFS domain-containing protein n=1 Tax=Rhabditophanes sp. KR3021 TaxID=114890 RepID=A0AC35TPG1_9BILA